MESLLRNTVSQEKKSFIFFVALMLFVDSA